MVRENIVSINDGGRQVEIRTGIGYTDTIDADDLRSASQERISRALQAVVAQTGLALDTGGVYRKVGARRASLDTGFDDICFRSKILSKAPNPTDAEILAWRPAVKKIANRVWYRFRVPLLAFGYEACDLESLGLVHLITALHRYRSGNPDKDAAIVGRYVNQRLIEVVRKVQRKGRRCTASSEIRSFAELHEG